MMIEDDDIQNLRVGCGMLAMTSAEAPCNLAKPKETISG